MVRRERASSFAPWLYNIDQSPAMDTLHRYKTYCETFVPLDGSPIIVLDIFYLIVCLILRHRLLTRQVHGFIITDSR